MHVIRKYMTGPVDKGVCGDLMPISKHMQFGPGQERLWPKEKERQREGTGASGKELRSPVCPMISVASLMSVP